MTRSEAKTIRNDLRDQFDLGMKYYLSICKFGRDDFGLVLSVQSKQLQIADDNEYHYFFTTRDPERMERMLSLICKRK